MVTLEFSQKTKNLIDNLKTICARYGLGNDGNEFKIITQVFLYKFLNDKFGFEIKKLDQKIQNSDNWERLISSYSDDEYEMLLLRLSPDSAKLKREHYISYLHNRLNESEFAKLFDDTLRDIAIYNKDIFSVNTATGAKVELFDELSNYITDSAQRDDFCRALVSQLVDFNFEAIFTQKYDFFATIFEYLIKDYNKDGGGKYAEYYTPHAVAKIMAAIMVTEPVQDVTVYDPSAGSGTLLMSIAHAIGEDRCTIYSQDISQKSSGMLRLNLILNNLVHSIPNIIKGDTLVYPYHKDGNQLKKFDYIVSNPPFKLDFSDSRSEIDTDANSKRFFAGVPNTPDNDKDKMPIYLLFIQHIVFSLSDNGRAAIVVPTGFLTAKKGIEYEIRKKIIDDKILKGVISMPSNIFATTNTNVSIIFIDKSKVSDSIMLIDASKLGKTVKDDSGQKTILSEEEEKLMIDVFNTNSTVENLSVCVTNDDIKAKLYSYNPGHYFKVRIEHEFITQVEFSNKFNDFKQDINELLKESNSLNIKIKEYLEKIKYE